MDIVWQFILDISRNWDVITALSIGWLIMMLACALLLVGYHASYAYHGNTKSRSLHCRGACEFVVGGLILFVGALACHPAAVYTNRLTGSPHDLSLMALWWLMLAVALSALLFIHGSSNIKDARQIDDDLRC